MIEVYCENEQLSNEEQRLIMAAAEAALAHEGRGGDLTVLVDDEAHIEALNREFRHVDRVTDVLTFPAWEGDEIVLPPDRYLGDIMICKKRAEEQAETYGHSLARELAFLTVHGVLHLLGYDHMEPADEQLMREKQTRILEGMGQAR